MHQWPIVISCCLLYYRDFKRKILSTCTRAGMKSNFLKAWITQLNVTNLSKGLGSICETGCVKKPTGCVKFWLTTLAIHSYIQ